jgi:hypothetical protein
MDKRKVPGNPSSPRQTSLQIMLRLADDMDTFYSPLCHDLTESGHMAQVHDYMIRLRRFLCEVQTELEDIHKIIHPEQ